MKNSIILFLIILGLVTFVACEDDIDRVTIKSNPTTPGLQISDMVLDRTKATDTIKIEGNDADFGFKASVNYLLQADMAGNNFATPVTLATGTKNSFVFLTKDLNTAFLDFLPEDVNSAIEIRVVADLGVAATEAAPTKVYSSVSAINVTTYGPPKMTFTTAGTLQKIASPGGDGIFSGIIYTDGTAFTLTAEDGSVYGAGANMKLVKDGSAIKLAAGVYNFVVNTNEMTIDPIDANIGIIGDALGSWDFDTVMGWDFDKKAYFLADVVIGAGSVKFRSHGSWGGAYNFGYGADRDLNNLANGGDSGNIDDIAAGTYDVYLYVGSKTKAVFVPAK